MSGMSAQSSYYHTPNTVIIDEDTLLSAGIDGSCYVVLACLASGGILEPVDDRLSGYGGAYGAPIFRLTGVTIIPASFGPQINVFYVSPDGSDTNDGKSYATAFATIERANAAAAAISPTKAIVNVAPSMLKLNVAQEYGTAKSASLAPDVIEKYLPGVVFWGDGLTAGVATTGYDGKSAWNPYPTVFGRLVQSNIIEGFSVAAKRVNMGVGGENSATIAGRANAIPVVLKSGVTIPASGKVAISMALKGYSDAFTPLRYSGIGYSNAQDVTIKGVAGKLTLQDGTYYFTRTTEGSAVSASAGDTVTFVSGNAYDNTNYIPVVFMGNNDGPASIAHESATCTKPGNTGYCKCFICGALYSDPAGTQSISASSVVIPARGHDIHDTVVQPTSGKAGYILHECSRCDYSATESLGLKDDANGDRRVDSDDALLILNYTLRPDIFTVAKGFDCDITKDNIVDSDMMPFTFCAIPFVPICTPSIDGSIDLRQTSTVYCPKRPACDGEAVRYRPKSDAARLAASLFK